MSYARFGWEGSDVYVYETSDDMIECCGCRLIETRLCPECVAGDCANPYCFGFEFTEPFPRLPTAAAMIGHLREHQSAGDHVPEATFRELEAARMGDGGRRGGR